MTTLIILAVALGVSVTFNLLQFLYTQEANHTNASLRMELNVQSAHLRNLSTAVYAINDQLRNSK